MGHVSHMNGSCLRWTHVWGRQSMSHVSHTNEACLSYTRMGHVLGGHMSKDDSRGRVWWPHEPVSAVAVWRCGVLLQCDIAVFCCSVLLQCVTVVAEFHGTWACECCCSVLLQCFVDVCFCTVLHWVVALFCFGVLQWWPRPWTHKPVSVVAMCCCSVLLQRVALVPEFDDRMSPWVTGSVCTAYCIWGVISPIPKLNRSSSSPRLCCHVPLKRDQLDWDWRMRLNDTPNIIGCKTGLVNTWDATSQ